MLTAAVQLRDLPVNRRVEITQANGTMIILVRQRIILARVRIDELVYNRHAVQVSQLLLLT